MSASYIEESKKLWYRNEGSPTKDDLILGCLQRIAAATELSCKDRERLERDYRYMRDARDSYCRQLATERRRTAALRGQIKKLRAAIAQGEKV